MGTVYISAKIPANAIHLLAEVGLTIRSFEGSGLITKAELIQAVGDIDYLITPLSTQVDAAVIDAAPHLKLIANFGAGFNNIDTAYAKTKGIPVTNTPAVSSQSTAEVTTSLILAVMHRVAEGDRLMRDKGFDGWAPLFFLGHQVGGKTVGIFGLGQIGQLVAKQMKAFGAKVIYTQRHQLSPDTEADLGVKFVTKDELLQNADIVTLHLPLIPATQHLLGEEEFSMMKDSAILINAARGPIIDETDLLQALQDHTLSGAGLDVYEHEPAVADGFKQLDNVVLTPHIGNATVEAREAMAEIVATNVIAMTRGNAPQFIVNA